MGVKLFVDDVRPAPLGWLVARTVADAKAYLLRDDIDEVSLDHDMGWCADCARTAASDIVLHCAHVEDGYQLVQWMIAERRVPAMVRVHSMNPDGKRRMLHALERYAAFPANRVLKQGEIPNT